MNPQIIHLIICFSGIFFAGKLLFHELEISIISYLAARDARKAKEAKEKKELEKPLAKWEFKKIEDIITIVSN